MSKAGGVTKRRILAIESAARKAWSEGFPSMNFPYDLEVRFGRLEQEAYCDPHSAFVRNEFKRLVRETRRIQRSAQDAASYRMEYKG